jgi:membrane-associated phospholipid phosphatase
MRRLLFSRSMPTLWVAAALAAALNLPAAPPQLPVVSPANPFRNLFINLGHDARSLGSLDSAIVLGVGGAGAISAHNSDARVHQWALDQPTTAPALAKFGNFYGDGVIQGGMAVGAWFAGKQTQNVKLESLGADLIRAQVLNGVITKTLKLTVDRTRPDAGRRGFPSGHASATFATAAVIQRDYGVAMSVPFYALGGLVSWSRVRTNHHWLSDVVFGGAVGIASGLAVTHGRPTHWSIVPVKTAGGAAIYVTRR